MPHFPAVLRIILGHYQQQVGGAILPTLGWGKQSVWLAASGSQRSFRAEARTHFIGRERKCCSALHTKKRNPAALPLCGPCRRKAGTESWRPENSVFSIFEANSDS